MHAIGIGPDDTDPRLLEVPDPTPADDEALVRTLRVGVDGTDHEVIAGAHGRPPDGANYHVLGHEAVGVVEDATGTRFDSGDVVAPTVRRPPADGPNEYFTRGEQDMAPPDATVECGIDGAHGFMREYFTSPGAYLVPVPPRLAPLGFLVEPISVVEKALELARTARSSFTWTPDTALVLGNGPLGLLAVAILVENHEVYCLGRRDRPDPTIDLIERLDATYVDSRETPVAAIPDAHTSADLVVEATGYAKHAFDCIEALSPNGVAALLGVPDDWTFEVDGGRLHEELVLENKAIVGSVNSGPRHFEAAVDTLESLPAWVLDDIVTHIAPYREFEAAFDRGTTTIKTAVEFSTHEER